MRKKIIAIIMLTAFSVVTLTSCTKNGTTDGNRVNNKQNIESLFQTVCSADEALELAKKSDAVVFEDNSCTSGNEVWESFFQSVSSKSPASVLCAHYYTLDKEHVSEELYEKEKDLYPQLFFCLLEYDGKEYSLKSRESSVKEPDYQEKFKYLLHFTGDVPDTSPYFTSFDDYVLVDDSSLTLEDILVSMTSSQLDKIYKHFTIYSDYH